MNATYLIRAGFIDQVMAGVYTFLPLGYRTLRKIEQIIREEMDKVASEVNFPAISPFELWETTGRLNTVDVLFKVSGANKASQERNGAEYVLNSTHEELVTPLAQKFISSYKDFPFSVYQIQTKFRNEPRAKSGLLRGREFRMKDSYSFHVSESDLLKYYDVMKQTYTTIFERLGLGKETVMALASGGDFTKEYSHEFQTICESGEDTLFRDPKTKIVYNREVTASQAPKVQYEQGEMKPMEEVLGEGLIGVEALAKHLGISFEQTTKTLLFKTSEGAFVAVAVRGGYEVDEEKLKKVLNVSSISMASAEEVEKITGCVPGYVGVLNLPKEVTVIFDESTNNRVNFECGANRLHYHTINVNFGRDIPMPEKFHDIKVAKEGDLNPETGEVYEVFKGAEVGNIFPLNTKFSKAFGYNFVDQDGKEKPIYMGCYGIGPSRIMGVIVEKFHDEKGILWPAQVAPFDVHLVSLKGGEDKARSLYDQLEAAGIEVLWDDRDESAGAKFADADLIGIPVRLVVSGRTEEGKVEFKKRDQEKAEILTVEEVISGIKK